jgi:hypothetical protein
VATKLKFLLLAIPAAILFWKHSEMVPAVVERVTERAESIQKNLPAPAKNLLATALDKVSALADDDQVGLDRLYEEVRPMLEKAKSNLEYIDRGNLKESFFIMSAWIRENEKPEALVLELLKEPIKNLPIGAHLVLGAQERKLRLLAYGLAKLRETNPKLANGEEFREALRERIKAEKSLDVTIEAIQLLKEVDPREKVADLLKDHSLEDRKLLSKFL